MPTARANMGDVVPSRGKAADLDPRIPAERTSSQPAKRESTAFRGG